MGERSGGCGFEGGVGPDLTGRKGLEDIVAALFGKQGGAAGAAASSARGSIEGVGQQAVIRRTDDCLQSLPELLKAFVVEPAFEDAFLNAHAVVAAGFGDAAEAAWAGDIVGDDAQHFFSAGRVTVRLGGQEVVPPIGGAGGVQLRRKGS